MHVTKRFGTSKFPNIEPCRACEPGVKTAPAHADSQSSSGTREPSKQFVLCDSLSFWLNSSLDIGPHVLHHFNVDSNPLSASRGGTFIIQQKKGLNGECRMWAAMDSDFIGISMEME